VVVVVARRGSIGIAVVVGVAGFHRILDAVVVRIAVEEVRRSIAVAVDQIDVAFAGVGQTVGRGDFVANDHLRRNGTPIWIDGPGTGFDDEWFSRARAGKLRVPGDGSAFVSLVHIADMAEATRLALRHWPGQRTLIISDDRPVRWGEVFAYVAQLVGAPPPEPGGRIGFPSFRVRNTRAREALDWAPHCADFRIGLAR
jgi:hypothetical protein